MMDLPTNEELAEEQLRMAEGFVASSALDILVDVDAIHTEWDDVLQASATHTAGLLLLVPWTELLQHIDSAPAATQLLVARRAFATMNEVHVLLRAGLPDGASARARTIHELHVVSRLSAMDSEVAARYLLWVCAEELADMKQQTGGVASSAGNADAVRELESYVEEAARQLGDPHFRKLNGWARPLFPSQGRITFVELEAAAHLENYRAHYLAACHPVHAGPSAAVAFANGYGRGFPDSNLSLGASDRRIGPFSPALELASASLHGLAGVAGAFGQGGWLDASYTLLERKMSEFIREARARDVARGWEVLPTVINAQ